MIFLGVLDNVKKDRVNALAIQLHCQKLFSSYLGYKKFGSFSIIRLLSMLAFSPHLIGGWGIYMLVVAPEHSICRN